MTDSPDAWAKQAREWDRFMTPLRPHADDTAVVARTATRLAAGRTGLEAVMLGVTAETATCAWPPATRLRAFDSSPDVIARLWPAERTPAGASAEVADWSAMPVETGAIDLVAADGALGCPPWPEEAAAVVAEVRRVLRPGGRFVARTSLRPERSETLEEILDDLEAGRIGGPFALKQRVAAALHTDGLAGMSMRAMWELWQELFPDQKAVAERFGWPFMAFTMPHDYRPDIRLVYPTLAELRALLAPHFRELECLYGSYELAERCPTLVLEPR